MSSKRKMSYARGYDPDDPDSSVTPCFQIDPDVELKEVPSTGAEYLLKVRKERQKCVVVTKCDKDFTKFARNQSRFVEEQAPSVAPDALKPTIEWQNYQVADFSDIRMYVSQLQTKKSSWPTNIHQIKIGHKDFAQWKTLFENSSPTLSCVFGLNQTSLQFGLEVLIQTLNHVKPGDSISQNTGQWIYALLACIPLPLLSDTISVLRELARKCADMRSHINVEDEGAIALVAPLNVFICLVSRYFRQFDLAD